MIPPQNWLKFYKQHCQTILLKTTWIMWTTWTQLSAVRERALNLITYSWKTNFVFDQVLVMCNWYYVTFDSGNGLVSNWQPSITRTRDEPAHWCIWHQAWISWHIYVCLSMSVKTKGREGGGFNSRKKAAILFCPQCVKLDYSGYKPDTCHRGILGFTHCNSGSGNTIHLLGISELTCWSWGPGKKW